MAGRTIRVKVPVDRLLASAQKERARIVKDHEKAVIKSEATQERWKEKALAALYKAADDLIEGKFDMDNVSHPYRNHGNSTISVTVKCVSPRVPEEPSTRNVDRDIALLQACTDTELSIGAEDNFGKYL